MAKYILGHALRKSARQSPILQHLLRAVDFVCIGIPLTALRWLPADRASACASRCFGWLGPRLAKSEVIRRNLRLAFPEKSEREINALLPGIWGNAGAVFAEYLHLQTICYREADKRLRIEIAADIETINNPSRPAVFVTAHQANWEISAASARQLGIPLAVVFSPPDNPWFAKPLVEWRKVLDCDMLPKDESMRPMIRAMKNGKSIGIVMDRRVDSGHPVPFFGIDKWTTIVPARLALRFNCDLVPVRVQRLHNSHFKISYLPPVIPDKSLANEVDQAVAMTAQINRHFEQWARERPQEWFCSKRLWPKNAAPATGQTQDTGASTKADVSIA